MSGLLNTLSDLHQQHREHREGRRGHRNDDDDEEYHRGLRHQGRSPHPADDVDPRYRSQVPDSDRGRGYAPPPGPPASYGQRADARAPYQQYEDRGPGQGRGYGSAGYVPPRDDFRGQSPSQFDRDRDREGYAPPQGPPRSAPGFGALGGLDRGDFASDEDIDRMVAAGEFSERGRGERGGYAGREGYDDGRSTGAPRGYDERGNDYGRYDAPSGPPSGRGHQSERAYDTPSGPPSGRGYQGERAYDTPSGPPSGRGYQGERAYNAPSGPPPGRGYQDEQGYGGGPERAGQYGPPQTQGRAQYDSPQGAPSGRGQSNAPAGGFSASRDEDRYGSGDRSEAPRRGEAAGYYNQRGQDDRYANLAGLAKEQGVDPDLCRRATAGLHERIEAQQSGPQRKDDDSDYKAQVDAHRKAYEGDDHGPMSNDAIGAAAAMEAFKQTAAASKAPAGGRPGGPSPKAAQEEEAAGSRGGGGLQDKLMAMAMSHAGQLFDKKNGGAGKSEDKAQAMQSAAATAMQLFGKYKAGKLESSDMASVMTLAMKML